MFNFCLFHEQRGEASHLSKSISFLFQWWPFNQTILSLKSGQVISNCWIYVHLKWIYYVWALLAPKNVVRTGSPRQGCTRKCEWLWLFMGTLLTCLLCCPSFYPRQQFNQTILTLEIGLSRCFPQRKVGTGGDVLGYASFPRIHQMLFSLLNGPVSLSMFAIQ